MASDPQLSFYIRPIQPQKPQPVEIVMKQTGVSALTLRILSALFRPWPVPQILRSPRSAFAFRVWANNTDGQVEMRSESRHRQPVAVGGEDRASGSRDSRRATFRRTRREEKPAVDHAALASWFHARRFRAERVGVVSLSAPCEPA